jgi:hypothetical protein
MQNFVKIYRQSLKHSFTNATMYVMVIAELAVSAFFILLMPSFMYNTGGDGPGNCYLMITFTSCILNPFFASVIGEINANASERIFVLSSPNKR